MVSLGSLYPRRKFPPYGLSPDIFKPQGLPSAPSSSLCWSQKILEAGTSYTRFPLSRAEEKHVDTYIIMSTTKTKTRTKYSKEVS